MVLISIILLISFITASPFENVTVLDIESRSEMKKYMKSISKDLGVKCSYCHDMDDKSLDNPIKDISREMIILTRQINTYLNEINKNEENKSVVTVTCWTCHKGNPHVEEERPKK
tara:strand:+ start:1187 stop:1531 length:345 start_codon:yes stop_codon:yes gene_type:complete